ncbi:hypothetical protein RRG08_055244 [Elysia crispata]|uniref:Uncharacterized protein n=1 Tax=Elysia crispata TaxID=231223 RepID=A0AAE1CMC3_9GAST|nr:hypothetical protein RRG08_055244 [Elysia crispata]
MCNEIRHSDLVWQAIASCVCTINIPLTKQTKSGQVKETEGGPSPRLGNGTGRILSGPEQNLDSKHNSTVTWTREISKGGYHGPR